MSSEIYILISSNYFFSFYHYLEPIVVLGLSLALIKFFDDSPSVLLSYNSFSSSKSPLIYSRNTGQSIGTEVDNLMARFPSSNWQLDPYAASSLSDFDNYHFTKRSRERIGAYWIDKLDLTTNNKIFNYSTIVATRNRDAYPFLLNQMNQQIIREVTNNNNFEISVTNAPFKMTYNEKNIDDGAKAQMAAFIFSLSLVGLYFSGGCLPALPPHSSFW